KNARVHLAYADWLLFQDRLDEARIHADTAARLDPKSKESERFRGLLARHLKDHATAEKIFEALHREAPADFFASNQLALVLIEQKKDESKRNRALQLAEVNARQYPRNAEALATLGWVLFGAGKLDEADKVLSASISGGQFSSDTAYYLACLLNARGKTEDIPKLLQAALDTQGAFVHRREARSWLADLKKKEKTKPKGK